MGDTYRRQRHDHRLGSDATLRIRTDGNQTGCGQTNVQTQFVINGLLHSRLPATMIWALDHAQRRHDNPTANAYGACNRRIELSRLTRTGHGEHFHRGGEFVDAFTNASPAALAVSSLNLSASTTFNVTGGGNLIRQRPPHERE